MTNHSEDTWARAYAESIYELDPTQDRATLWRRMLASFAEPSSAPFVDDSGFERADEYQGPCRDDDEQADRAAEREAAWLSGGAG